MIDRLLVKLETPRRHLAFLVGLLALVFVLTAVVAWRASEADQERVNMANTALTESAANTLALWSGLYQQFAGSTMESMQITVGAPDVMLDSLWTSIPPERVCKSCRTGGRIRTFFAMDPRTGAVRWSGEPMSEALVDELRGRVTSGQVVPFHERIHAGLHFVEVDGGVAASFVYLTLGRDGSPVRLTGMVLDSAMSTEMIDFVFASARSFPHSPGPDAADDHLFARAAFVGRTELMGPVPAEGLQRRVVEAPVYGLTLGIAPHQAAPGLLPFGLNRTAERTMVFVLMVLISALLITAMLQVRRESALAQLRADFVSGVTHELRTPLAQIRMFTETVLLGRVRSDVERRRSLEIIDQEARRLSHLVENVLLFSKTEGGRHTKVAPEPTHFADEIRRAVESLSLLCRSRSAEVRLELQENITVPVDRMALRQILINLVDNALKYGPTGQRITVGAALFEDVARVWVDDEGPGVPVEERGRIFDSFYRLPRESQSRVSGSGIGLAVVRELARLHRGDAWAESAPERGARIVVQFPDAYLRTEEKGDLAAAS
ncbi:MAG TPA: HAMP domain-containing sensor histidine kinase [Longimicrobiales bacterium]